MPIDPTVLANILDRSLTGQLSCAGYWAVYWDENDATETRYYAEAAHDQFPPFINIGHPIEPRIMNWIVRDTTFEINPDLRTETIKVVFDDIDREIRTKFQTFGSGIECELFFYYPEEDATISLWFGQLQAPDVYGWKQLETVATNGFRSREQFVPKRLRPRECTANFGGLLPDADSIRSNLCPYDRHIGGSVGNFISGSTPYADCPRLTEADCLARLPALPNGKPQYYGGFATDASATLTDANSGYFAVAKGNASKLKEPIRVAFGTKHIRSLPVLLWRREQNNSTPDHGFVRAIYEVGEGPVKTIRNIKVNEKLIEQIHLSVRPGERGQVTTGYATNISNFSNTAHFSAALGWVNPNEYTAQNLSAEADIDGLRDVAVFNNPAAGKGIIGQYFSDTTWSTLVGTRIDRNINFPSSTVAPFEGMPQTDFSIRWDDSTITFEFSETYTITALHDNGIKVWIDGGVVIDQLGTLGTHTGTFAATADTPYSIRVDFIQGTSPGIHPWEAILKWNSASLPIEVIPPSAFDNGGDVSGGYIRQWTNDRVWALMECYSNQRFGAAYAFSRFEIGDWYDASYWGLQTTTFTHTFPDGEVKSYTRRRTTFDAILEGRSLAEQIEDICRSGAFCIPFQHEGKFSIRPFRVATTDELTAARVFTDTGESRNILWDDGQPSITLSQIPDGKLTNEIVMTFEEASNGDTERPITVDNPDQKLLAGRALGENNLQSVPKKYTAFGVRYIEEALKLAYRLLWFGEFDSGGTENNLRLEFRTPFEQVLGLKRYDIIKVESDLLAGFLSPDGDPFEYFRVTGMRKIEGGLAEITAQAYNHDKYTAFETVVAGGETPEFPPSPIPGPFPDPCTLTFTATYDPTLQLFVIPVPPC